MARDASTELEELLLETQIRVHGIQPTLTLLYHSKLPQSLLNKVVDCIRGGSGQPQILNNTVVIERNLARFAQYKDGITLEDARNCGNYGCVSTGICGKGSFITQEDQPCLAKTLSSCSIMARILPPRKRSAPRPATRAVSKPLKKCTMP